MLTYGDGVADVDICRLVAFHKAHGKLATVTAVRPPSRFGGLRLEGDSVLEFEEKPQIGEGWINGGFFVLEPKVLDYIPSDDTLWERGPLESPRVGRRAARLPPRGLLAADGHRPRHAPPRVALDRAPSTLEGLEVSARKAAAPTTNSGGAPAFWRDRPTLVTGATGLVGGWLVRQLLDARRRRRLPRARLGPAERRPPATRSCRASGSSAATSADQALMERVLGEYEIDVVFHLAAQTVVGIANRNPVSTFESNIRGTWACSRRAAAPRPRRGDPRVVRQGLRRPDRLPYDRSDRAPGTPSVRRQQVVRGPDRAGVREHLRPPGRRSRAAATSTAAVTSTGTASCPARSARYCAGSGRSSAPTARSSATTSTSRTAPPPTSTLAEAVRARPELAGQAFNFSNEIQVTVLDLTRRILRPWARSLEPDVRAEAPRRDRPSVAERRQGAGTACLDAAVRARRLASPARSPGTRSISLVAADADELRARILALVAEYHDVAFAEAAVRAGRVAGSRVGPRVRRERGQPPRRRLARLLADDGALRRATSSASSRASWRRRHALLVNSGSSANLVALSVPDVAVARRPPARAGRRGHHRRRRASRRRSTRSSRTGSCPCSSTCTSRRTTSTSRSSTPRSRPHARHHVAHTLGNPFDLRRRDGVREEARPLARRGLLRRRRRDATTGSQWARSATWRP